MAIIQDVIFMRTMLNYRYGESCIFFNSSTTGRIECGLTQEDREAFKGLRNKYDIGIDWFGVEAFSYRDYMRQADYTDFKIINEMTKLPKMPPHAKFTALRLKGVI